MAYLEDYNKQCLSQLIFTFAVCANRCIEMADLNSSRSEPTYNSYADYVASAYGDWFDTHSWLVNFLRNGYPGRCWERQAPEIEIYVLDSVNDILESRSFIAPRRGPVDQAFLDVLHEPSSKRRTRLVMLQCGQLGDTNHSYIDAIGLHYMLDPFFFSAHFERCRDVCEGGNLNRPSPPVLLPSEQRFLQTITDSFSHMTAAWKMSGDERTCKVALSLIPTCSANAPQLSCLDWTISALVASPSCVLNSCNTIHLKSSEFWIRTLQTIFFHTSETPPVG